MTVLPISTRTAEQLLVGESHSMQNIRDMVSRAAPRRNPVLIHGPTGSGKELVARLLHMESGRTGRFVPVNVAALSDTLFEAELFGHVRGAFSGAVQTRLGLLRSADKGTVFLDEIGELPLALQAKLLRVLEDHEVRPVGADFGHRVDIRVVAATNADLSLLAQDGRFRHDLLYRLQGTVLEVPPLRSHLEDIDLLISHFVDQIAVEHDERPMVMDPSCLDVFRDYSWPGNVRELREVLGRIALEANGMRVLPAMIRRALNPRLPLQDNLSASLEAKELEALWIAYGRDVNAVAKVLDVAPSTVYRRMHRLGIPVGPRGRRAAKLHNLARVSGLLALYYASISACGIANLL